MRPDEAARIARELLEQQRYRDAQRICHEALGPAPQSAELWELIGRAQIAEGDLRSGIENLRRALSVDAGVPATWCALIEAYARLDRVADASATVAAALDRFPHDAELQALLALQLLASGQADDALETADVALASQPDCVNAHRAAAGAALALRALDRAERHCRQTLELEPLDIGTRRRLALVHHGRGDAAAAAAVLEEALSIEPAHPHVLDELAGHYRRLGRSDDAAACWERLAALHPDQPGVLQASGRGLADTGRTAAALPHLAQAARDPAVDPRVWLDLSSCLDAERRPDQALAACEQYLSLRPGDAEGERLRERLTIRLEVE